MSVHALRCKKILDPARERAQHVSVEVCAVREQHLLDKRAHVREHQWPAERLLGRLLTCLLALAIIE